MILTRIVTVAALCFLLNPAVSAQETWKAGVAKANITPPQPMWMSGYASRSKPAEGKSHDLWAKAIVLEDPSGKRVILVTMDLVGIDRETSQQICGRLQKEHNIDRSQIALSTSHTHSGPVVGTNLLAMFALDEPNLQLIRDYTVFLSDSVAKATSAATAKIWVRICLRLFISPHDQQRCA